MTTQPKSEKPSERYGRLVMDGYSRERAMHICHLAYLDEQHAAGQVPVAAVEYPDAEQAWGDLPQDIAEMLQYRSFVAGYNHAGVEMEIARSDDRISAERHIPVEPVAAPPAQPAAVEPELWLSADDFRSPTFDSREPSDRIANDEPPALSVAAKGQVEALTKRADILIRDNERLELNLSNALTDADVLIADHAEAIRSASETTAKLTAENKRLDEELHQLDDVVRELGGNPETGIGPFIRETHVVLTAAQSIITTLTGEKDMLVATCAEANERLAVVQERVEQLEAAARLALAWFDQDGSVGMSDEAMAPLREVVFGAAVQPEGATTIEPPLCAACDPTRPMVKVSGRWECLVHRPGSTNVATGERAILVGSTWRDPVQPSAVTVTSTDEATTTFANRESGDRHFMTTVGFLRRYIWLSDPPATPTP